MIFILIFFYFQQLISEKKEALVKGHGMLTSEFFQRSSPEVARDLIGKVIRVYYAPEKLWLSARIIESVTKKHI